MVVVYLCDLVGMWICLEVSGGDPVGQLHVLVGWDCAWRVGGRCVPEAELPGPVWRRDWVWVRWVCTMVVDSPSRL